MKLSNYIANFLKEKKNKTYFLNNGGAISFLADELVRSKNLNFYHQYMNSPQQ